jgi:hypothetical protein
MDPNIVSNIGKITIGEVKGIIKESDTSSQEYLKGIVNGSEPAWLEYCIINDNFERDCWFKGE